MSPGRARGGDTKSACLAYIVVVEKVPFVQIQAHVPGSTDAPPSPPRGAPPAPRAGASSPAGKTPPRRSPRRGYSRNGTPTARARPRREARAPRRAEPDASLRLPFASLRRGRGRGRRRARPGRRRVFPGCVSQVRPAFPERRLADDGVDRGELARVRARSAASRTAARRSALVFSFFGFSASKCAAATWRARRARRRRDALRLGVSYEKRLLEALAATASRRRSVPASRPAAIRSTGWSPTKASFKPEVSVISARSSRLSNAARARDRRTRTNAGSLRESAAAFFSKRRRSSRASRARSRRRKRSPAPRRRAGRRTSRFVSRFVASDSARISRRAPPRLIAATHSANATDEKVAPRAVASAFRRQRRAPPPPPPPLRAARRRACDRLADKTSAPCSIGAGGRSWRGARARRARRLRAKRGRAGSTPRWSASGSTSCSARSHRRVSAPIATRVSNRAFAKASSEEEAPRVLIASLSAPHAEDGGESAVRDAAQDVAAAQHGGGRWRATAW